MSVQSGLFANYIANWSCLALFLKGVNLISNRWNSATEHMTGFLRFYFLLFQHSKLKWHPLKVWKWNTCLGNLTRNFFPFWWWNRNVEDVFFSLPNINYECVTRVIFSYLMYIGITKHECNPYAILNRVL